MKFSSAKLRSGKHVMLHGAPKSGKSQLVGMLAEAGYNLIWLSTDGGHGVLSKLSPAAQERVELVHLPDTRKFPVAQDTVRKVVAGGKHLICDAHGQINCSACMKAKDAATWVTLDINALTDNDILVIDHISGVAESVINKICEKDFQKHDTYKFTWDDYRSQGSVMHDILSHIQHSSANIICIAHTLEVTSEDKSKILVPEVGTRNFSDTVGKYFDHIVYLHILNNGHRAGSSTTYRAGVLTGSRGDVAIEGLTPSKADPAILSKLFSPLIIGQSAEISAATQKLLVATKSKVEEVRDVQASSQGEVPVAAVEAQTVAQPATVSARDAEVAKSNAAAEVVEKQDPAAMTADQRMKLLLANMKKGSA